MSEIPKYVKKFNENGFVVIPNVIKQKEINQIYNALINLVEKYTCKKYTGSEPWNNNQFHKDLELLHELDGKNFSKLYDSLQTHSIIQKIGISEKILKITSNLLEKNKKVPWKNLSNTPPLFRMDLPKKDDHKVDWHQERVSYDQNDDGNNGLIVWIPLQNVNRKTGTLDVCIGSHKSGFIKPSHSGTYGNIQTSNKFIDENLLKKYSKLSVKMNVGDVLFVSMLTAHKSGKMDFTRKFRFTVTTRIHNSFSDDFNPGRLRFIRNSN